MYLCTYRRHPELTDLSDYFIVLQHTPCNVYAIVVPVGSRHLLVHICIDARHAAAGLLGAGHNRPEPMLSRSFAHRIKTDHERNSLGLMRLESPERDLVLSLEKEERHATCQHVWEVIQERELDSRLRQNRPLEFTENNRAFVSASKSEVFLSAATEPQFN